MHLNERAGKEKTSNRFFDFLHVGQCLIILFLLGFSASLSSAQDADPLTYFKTLEAPDSILYDTIKAYYKSKVYSFPETVLKLTNLHMSRAKSSNHLPEMIQAQNYKATAKYVMEDFDGTIQELENLVALAKEAKDEYTMYRAYNNMGNVCYMRREILEAFRYYSTSLPYFRAQGNKKGEAGILLNIGLIYMAIGDYDKALENFEQTLKMESNLPEAFIGGEIWRAVGTIKRKKEMYPEAITNYNKALSIYEAQENPRGRLEISILLAKTYFGLGVKEKAISYAEQGIELAEKWNYSSRIIPIKAILVNIYLEDDLHKASGIAEEIQAIGFQDQENYDKVEISKILYNCYKAQNNAPKALKAHEDYSKYSDSLKIEVDKSGVLKQKIEYEYAEQLREKEIGFQTEQDDLKKSQTKWLSGIIIFSLVSIFGILIFAQRKLTRNKLEKQNLLQEIELLKSNQLRQTPLQTDGFQLSRARIEESVSRSINETDWKVLNILLEDPFIKNALIAEKAYMSVDGIGSSLRRMYQAFEIKDSRYMKISLLMEAIKISK